MASSGDGSHGARAVGLLPGQPASWCCVGGMGAGTALLCPTPLQTEEGVGGCSVSTAWLQLQRPAGIGTRTHPISVFLVHREAEKNNLQ